MAAAQLVGEVDRQLLKGGFNLLEMESNFAERAADAPKKYRKCTKLSISEKKPKKFVPFYNRLSKSDKVAVSSNAERFHSMTHQPEKHTLPTAGFIRQSVLLPYLGFSASTLWRKVKQGTFPAPVKLSVRVTAWSAESVSAWVMSKNTVK